MPGLLVIHVSILFINIVQKKRKEKVLLLSRFPLQNNIYILHTEQQASFSLCQTERMISNLPCKIVCSWASKNINQQHRQRNKHDKWLFSKGYDDKSSKTMCRTWKQPFFACLTIGTKVLQIKSCSVVVCTFYGTEFGLGSLELMYCTHAIISRGLYIFLPHFSLRFIIKSGFLLGRISN